MNAFLAVCGVAVLAFTVDLALALWDTRKSKHQRWPYFAACVPALLFCGVYALLPAIAWLRGGGQ